MRLIQVKWTPKTVLSYPPGLAEKGHFLFEQFHERCLGISVAPIARQAQ